MRFSYGTALYIIAGCCSGIAARPGPLYPRFFFNTSSAVESFSTTETVPSFGSGSIIFTSSTTSTASTSSIPDSVIPKGSDTFVPTTNSQPNSTQSLQTGSSSATSSPITLISSSSLSVTSTISPTTSLTSNYATIPTTTPIITSTTSFNTSSTASFNATSTTSFNTTSTPISNSTLTTSSACLPSTSEDATGSLCLLYCSTATSFLFANTTSTVTALVTVYGNSTSFPPAPATTPLLQPCGDLPTWTAIPTTVTKGCPDCEFRNFTGNITGFPTETETTPVTTALLTTPPPSSAIALPTTISLITSKTTVTSFVTVPKGSSFQESSVQNKISQIPQTPVTQTPPILVVTPSVGGPLQVSHGPSEIPGSGTTQNSIGESSIGRAAQGPVSDPPSTPTQDPPHLPATGAGPQPSQQQGDPSPTVTVDGVPIDVSATAVIIDGNTILPNAGSTAITAGGQVFTVNPSQIIAPGTTIDRLIPSPGVSLTGAPTPTVVDGIPVIVGSSVAIIDGTPITIGPGAGPSTTVIGGQTISVGPGGIGFSSTTVGGPGAAPTTEVINGETVILEPPSASIMTVDGVTFTEVGSTIVLVGSQTFTIGPEATPTTEVINGHTFSIGPGGIGTDGTTIAAPDMPITRVVTAGGITVTEIGSTLVVIGGSTFTVGPQARPTTDVFDSQTISIGPGGIGFASTTVQFPFPAATQVFTTHGITFTEVGSTIAVIGGTTFTIGPGATPTTDIYNGQTISVGPGGVGFLASGKPSAVVVHGGAMRPKYIYGHQILAFCVLLSAWCLF